MTSTSIDVPPVIGTCQSEPLRPITPVERIGTLDVLRGFSLFGILLVNMALFSWPFYYLMLPERPWVDLLDVSADWLVRFLAEGKFYTLFSFLFGLGIGIQIQRSDALQRKATPLLLRRLFALLGIGLLHALLVWEGDILTSYAVFGFGLLAFQHRKPKTLLIWAACCLAIPVVVYAALWILLSLASLIPEAARGIDQAFAAERSSARSLAEQNIRIFSQGTWGQIFVQRAQNVLAFWQWTWFYAPTFFGMFLLGLYTAQRRMLQHVEAHAGFLRRVLFWGLVIGLPANLFYALSYALNDPLMLNAGSVLRQLALDVGGPALCLGYAAGLTLLLQRETWRRLLRPVAAAGRMALTNYLMQSLVCTTLCYSYGLGWYGSLGRAAGLGVALLLYLTQLVLSVWWLRSFPFGPAEWLWRSVAYGKPQPMRI